MARLGDYIEQIRGVSYKPEDVCTAQDKDAVAILRANNIQDDGLNFDDLVYVKKSKVSAIQYIKAGDIVVCASSGSKNLVGKAAIATEDMDFSFGAFCKVVRPRKLLPSYVGHYFQSPKYRNKISELAGGANINNIRNEHIDELDIVVPNTDEQERISIELNKNCYLIALRKQQLSKLDELVKSRFIELFGAPILNPKGFAEGTVNEYCKMTQGTQIPMSEQISEYQQGYYRYLYIRDLKYDDSNWIYVQDKYDDKKLTEKDLVVVNTGNTAGEIYYGKDGILSNNLFKVSFDTNILNTTYMFAYFSSPEFQSMLWSEMKEGTQPHLGHKIFGSKKLIIPPIDLQNQFAAFVEQTDKSKFEIQQSLEKLETLKKALMQKYFG